MKKELNAADMEKVAGGGIYEDIRERIPKYIKEKLSKGEEIAPPNDDELLKILKEISK